MADVLDLNAEEFVEEDEGKIIIKTRTNNVQFKKNIFKKP